MPFNFRNMGKTGLFLFWFCLKKNIGYKFVLENQNQRVVQMQRSKYIRTNFIRQNDSSAIVRQLKSEFCLSIFRKILNFLVLFKWSYTLGIKLVNFNLVQQFLFILTCFNKLKCRELTPKCFLKT